MGGSALLLDTYTGAAAAYSLRKLKSDYTGKVLQVRRASDHVEVDVGFDSNGLLSLDSPVTNVTEESTGITQGSSTNAAKLGEFCGEARRSGGDTSYATVDSMTEAAHVEVVTWYDQSGNTNNATQVAASNQPRIYDRSSGLTVENGKPAVDLIDRTDFLMANLSLTQPCTIFSVNKAEFNNTYSLISRGGIPGIWYGYLNNGTYGVYAGTWLTANGSSNQRLDAFLIDGNSSELYQDGGLLTSGNTGTANSTGNNIGHFEGGFSITGTIQELIFYNSDQSGTPQSGIETNINTFYSIY